MFHARDELLKAAVAKVQEGSAGVWHMCLALNGSPCLMPGPEADIMQGLLIHQ